MLAREHQVEPGGALREFLAVTVRVAGCTLPTGVSLAIKVNESNVQQLLKRILFLFGEEACFLEWTVVLDFDIGVAAQKAVPVGVVPLTNMVPQPIQPFHPMLDRLLTLRLGIVQRMRRAVRGIYRGNSKIADIHGQEPRLPGCGAR